MICSCGKEHDGPGKTCPRCRENIRNYQRNNKQKVNEWKKDWAERNPENKKRWIKNNRDKLTTNQRTYGQRLRIRVLEYMGGKCVSPTCRWVNGDGSVGCTDFRALQIDHINGGGTKENLTLNRGQIYLKVLRGAEGYQLLCANCNWIKKHENKEVPNLKISVAAGFAAGR